MSKGFWFQAAFDLLPSIKNDNLWLLILSHNFWSIKKGRTSAVIPTL